MNNELNIIFEDKNLIIVEKYQGIPCQADKTNDKDLLSEVSSYIGNDAFLVHRLDRPVGGIMIFAKNKNTCSSLSSQIQEKTFKKTYLAVVCGIPEEPEKTLVDYMIKNQRLNLSKIVNKNNQGAKRAELSYKLLKTCETDDYGKLSLLEIDLKTGRHHQIRLQLSNIGLGIWGDTKYNDKFKRHGEFSFHKFVNISLFSTSIEFINPTTKQLEKYSLTPPNEEPFSFFK